MGAGYSGTPLPRKLGIVAGARVAVVDDPGHANQLLEQSPADVRFDATPDGADVVLWFVTERAVLVERIEALGRSVHPDRMLWVAWPKRTSGVVTDVTEDVIREVALPLGLVDTKVCAIDATWSGLRLVWRRELRG